MTNDELLDMAREFNARGEAYALVTVVRAIAPTSAWVGAQALVLADGTLHGWIGGGCAKQVVVGAAREAIASGEPKLVRISNEPMAPDAGVDQHAMACASNGTVEVFVQPYSTRTALCVLGDTPAADEARFLAQRLRIRLTGTPAEAPVVLVATQGQGDEEALEAALRSTAAHVLMIASRKKADALRAKMRARGLGDAALARLQAPAGPDAGAKTPGEIALVAMVGVLALLRGRAAVKPRTFVNPVCGIEVSVDAAMHVETYEGESFYFCCDGCWTTFRQDPARYAARRQAV
jgi:xanthine dehydrogenase accessory factor